MADYNIKIAVDSRRASAGVKSFTGDLNAALKALRKFDSTSKGAFAQLDKLGKTNLGNLQKSARGTAQALQTLNNVKVSKATINSLQTLQQVLRNFRFNVAAIKAVPDALNALNRVRIDSRLPTVINQMKAALVGFRGPPKGAVDNLLRLANGLALIQPGRIEAAANALAKLNGFKFSAPRGGLGNIGRQGGAIRGLQSQIGGLTNSLGVLRTAFAGVSATFLARGIYQTGNAFQTLQRTLGTVATNTGEVGDQMKFLTGLTDRMPVSLEAVAASYGKFAIAARLSGVTAAQTQNTFEGFATAFSAMGVGAEAQKRGFEALIQMMSKGKIQAEEIRQQLAEALPGAMTLLAESMGVTTAQLSKMLEQGEVLSSELPKMAALLQSRFGPAVEMAMMRASAQLTNLGNEWTTIKNLLFNSGFESGLGAFARNLTEALKTDVVRDFATQFGRGLEVSMTHMAAFVKTISQNATALKTIVGGVAVVIASVLARSLLFVLGPAIGLTVTAFNLLGKAALLAQARMLAIPAAVTLMAVGLDQLANGGRATAAILDRLASAAKQVGNGLGGIFGNLAGGSMDDLGADFARNLREAQEYASRIANSPLVDPAAIARNGQLEADNAAKKLASLTDAEQAVWEEANAIGHANSEYQKQIALLDQIAAKKGIDVSGQKSALAASTLDDRNPAGALARDLRADLANLMAKTGEQRALNAATEDYNALLARGQDIGAKGLDALRAYHVQIAKMNGEIGNGFQRWAATVGDWNDQMNDAITDGIGGLSDEITNFVTGAEADFAGLARSILRTVVKISLDSLLKDFFGGGQEQKSASLAEQALQKLASIGETITTAQTNVYTSGLSINGVPLGSAGALPGITRSALPDIPGTNVAGRLSDGVNTRFPLEGGAHTTGKTNRLGYIDPNIDPARFGPRASNPFLDLIGRAEGTDKGRGYNESLAYGKFTGGPQNLTSMSLNQIDALQSRMLAHPENNFNSSALGRYQIVRKTRRGLQNEMGLSGNELFDEGMQDRMALRLMERRGNNVAGLRNEWEGLRRVDPSTIQTAYAGATVDPAATASINTLNASLQTIGTTASQAGMMAGTAAPSFTNAGTAIATAGESAAAGAANALGKIGQLAGAFGGPWGSAISRGIGMLGGLFSEGGYSNSPVARASMPAGVWANAPHFAEGTANTSGGMPAVLHPNEAVIPLSRGREVPVTLNDNTDDRPAGGRRGPESITMNFNGFKDIDQIRRTKAAVKASALAGMSRANMRNA